MRPVKAEKPLAFEVFPQDSEQIKGCKRGKDGQLVQGYHESYIMSCSSASLSFPTSSASQ